MRRSLLIFALALAACSRNDLKPAPEKRRENTVASFERLATGRYPRGFFFDGSFAVPADGFDVFDLMSHAKSHVQTTLPVGVACEADDGGILCLHQGSELDVHLLAKLAEPPRKLPFTLPGAALAIRSDPVDWFIARVSDEYHPARWGEVVAISRPGGTRRSIASAPNLTSFSIDERHVYWLEGESECTVFRKPKLGGPTERIGATSKGDIFVRGEWVHHRALEGALTRAPKSGGAFVDFGVKNVDLLVADESGFCGCSGADPSVFCRGADEVNRPLVLPAKAKCDWMALSRSHLVVQSGDALWVAARP